ncbi:hypothetical protein D3C73_1077270 [compost metagenome]
MYQYVDIVASPVVNFLDPVVILTKGNLIRYRCISAIRIGVKIIIEMNTIYIVVFDHIHYHINNIFTNFRNTWVEKLLASIGEEPFWVALGNMVIRKMGRI